MVLVLLTALFVEFFIIKFEMVISGTFSGTLRGLVLSQDSKSGH